jgi:hypothetical protein
MSKSGLSPAACVAAAFAMMSAAMFVITTLLSRG